MPSSRNDSVSSVISQRTVTDEIQPPPPVTSSPTEISPTITVAPNHTVSSVKQATLSQGFCTCNRETAPVTGLFVADDAKSGFQEIKVSTVRDTLNKVGSQHKIVLIKANANVLRKCQECKDALCEAFNMPKSWWGDEMKRINGYFGSDEEWHEDKTLTSHSTWCRLMAKHCDTSSQYKWVKLNMFTRTEFQTKRTVILSFETHPRLDFNGNYNSLSDEAKDGQCRTSLQEILLSELRDTDLSDPYWMYRPILQSLLYIQERAIWKVRNLVRVYESDGKKDTDGNHANFADMHVIGRHAIHVNETLLLTIEALTQMVESHSELYQTLAMTRIDANGAYVICDDDTTKLQPRQTILSNRMHKALVNHRSGFSMLSLRADATHQRLQSEIQLAFNVTTQVDSRAMRNISLLTMVFLPSTFVATIFSTTFFSVDNNVWAMNDKFWIFVVFAIPVTALVMLWWYFIQERQLSTSAIMGIDRRRQKKMAKEEKPMQVGPAGDAQHFITGNGDFAIDIPDDALQRRQ